MKSVEHGLAGLLHVRNDGFLGFLVGRAGHRDSNGLRDEPSILDSESLVAQGHQNEVFGEDAGRGGIGKDDFSPLRYFHYGGFEGLDVEGQQVEAVEVAQVV